MSPEPEKVISSPSPAEKPWEELKEMRLRIHEILNPALERLRIAESADAVEIIGFLFENATGKDLGKQYVHPLVHVHHQSLLVGDGYFALGGFGLRVASHAYLRSTHEHSTVHWEGCDFGMYPVLPHDYFDFISGKCFFTGQGSGAILREGLDELVGDKSLSRNPTVMLERARALLNGFMAASSLQE